MREKPYLGPLENSTWLLEEARLEVPEYHRAPLIAVRTYEVWMKFLADRQRAKQ